MPKLHRYLSCCILGLCAVLLIVACDRSVSSPPSDRAISSSESCRLVPHEMGKTEVCGQPQKVAALSPHILDSMLALGVQPVAYAESEDLKIQTYDNPAEQIPYIGKWVTTQPMGLGDRKSPSLERLTLIEPDSILGEKWLHKDEYPLLSEIAPTLLFSDEQSDGQQVWQEDIRGVAKALGREAQAKELLAAFDQQIAQARAALQPVLQTYPRVLLIESNLTTYLASRPESTTARLLREIGFEIVQPPGVQGYAEISWEILPQIETDIILVLSWSDDGFSNPEATMQQKWAKNPLLNSMPIFQQGRVFFVDYQLWGSNIRGPLTDRLILEALPDLLLDSVKGAEEAEEAVLKLCVNLSSSGLVN
jgi:iron complex transport system substrate-binding protein